MKSIKLIIATALLACALVVGTHDTTTKQATDTTTITDPGGTGGGGN